MIKNKRFQKALQIAFATLISTILIVGVGVVANNASIQKTSQVSK